MLHEGRVAPAGPNQVELLQGDVEPADVGRVVPRVVDRHGLGVDVGLERLSGVGQRWEGVLTRGGLVAQGRSGEPRYALSAERRPGQERSDPGRGHRAQGGAAVDRRTVRGW